MFTYSMFKGNISNWDLSGAQYIEKMFKYSQFNGDISKWDVSKVVSMKETFFSSHFYGNISKWDLSSLQTGEGIFAPDDPRIFTILKGLDIPKLIVSVDNLIIKEYPRYLTKSTYNKLKKQYIQLLKELNEISIFKEFL